MQQNQQLRGASVQNKVKHSPTGQQGFIISLINLSFRICLKLPASSRVFFSALAFATFAARSSPRAWTSGKYSSKLASSSGIGTLSAPHRFPIFTMSCEYCSERSNDDYAADRCSKWCACVDDTAGRQAGRRGAANMVYRSVVFYIA